MLQANLINTEQKIESPLQRKSAGIINALLAVVHFIILFIMQWFSKVKGNLYVNEYAFAFPLGFLKRPFKLSVLLISGDYILN